MSPPTCFAMSPRLCCTDSSARSLPRVCYTARSSGSDAIDGLLLGARVFGRAVGGSGPGAFLSWPGRPGWPSLDPRSFPFGRSLLGLASISARVFIAPLTRTPHWLRGHDLMCRYVHAAPFAQRPLAKKRQRFSVFLSVHST